MKVVTVHRGARDSYQVTRALAEAGLLEALVTDLYWPADRWWAQQMERFMPGKVSAALRGHSSEQVPSTAVSQCLGSGLPAQGLSKFPWTPFDWKRDIVRRCDRVLGERAGRLATESDAALLAYSYYGYSAFSHYAGKQPRMLFQLHPHPASVRRILQRERKLHPDCAASLDKEWELALPQEDFNRLVEEPAMADYHLVASQFTKKTLVDHGADADRVAVVPYGIDLERYVPRRSVEWSARPLRVLFVGTLCQRKGIKYLLQALELLPKGSVELTVCGRPVDDMALLRESRTPIRLFPSISAEGLLEAYQYTDVFVFPSLAEGFAHVLLEAMASGLPIIATDRTAAPDLMRQGEEGYIVEAGKPAELAKNIEKFLQDPRRIWTMGRAARRRAEEFTWARFRSSVAEFVGGVLNGSFHAAARETCSRS
jgi:glycosyltransferase involved in cell wall biosynthesis